MSAWTEPTDTWRFWRMRRNSGEDHFPGWMRIFIRIIVWPYPSVPRCIWISGSFNLHFTIPQGVTSMPIRLFRGGSGLPGLLGRRGRKRWGPPRLGRRPGPPGGVPPMLEEFPPEGPWGEPFGFQPELSGPPGPWEEDLWDMPPGPWRPYPGLDDDF